MAGEHLVILARCKHLFKLISLCLVGDSLEHFGKLSELCGKNSVLYLSNIGSRNDFVKFTQLAHKSFELTLLFQSKTCAQELKLIFLAVIHRKLYFKQILARSFLVELHIIYVFSQPFQLIGIQSRQIGALFGKLCLVLHSLFHIGNGVENSAVVCACSLFVFGAVFVKLVENGSIFQLVLGSRSLYILRDERSLCAAAVELSISITAVSGNVGACQIFAQLRRGKGSTAPELRNILHSLGISRRRSPCHIEHSRICGADLEERCDVLFQLIGRCGGKLRNFQSLRKCSLVGSLVLEAIAVFVGNQLLEFFL